MKQACTCESLALSSQWVQARLNAPRCTMKVPNTSYLCKLSTSQVGPRAHPKPREIHDGGQEKGSFSRAQEGGRGGGGRLGLFLPGHCRETAVSGQELQDLTCKRHSTLWVTVWESHVTTCGTPNFTKRFPGNLIYLLSLGGRVRVLRGDKWGEGDLSIWPTGDSSKLQVQIPRCH